MAEDLTSIWNPAWELQGGRISVCSWNLGNGAHKRLPFLSSSGYHIIILQEAPGRVRNWPQEGWDTCNQENQFIGGRHPIKVTTVYAARTRSCL